MSDLSNQAAAPPTKHRRNFLLPVLLVIAVLAAAYGYYRSVGLPAGLGQTAAVADVSPEALDKRLLAVEQNLLQLERERAALQQRVADSANRTNLLRDEVLGVTERAGLIEDSLRELSRSERSGQDSLRISEAELLLTIASERWKLSGDLAGAIQATELASQAINALKDPQWVNLRQVIAQELAAFRALGPDPSAAAKAELTALEAVLPQLTPANGQPSKAQDDAHGATRLLNALIRIQPSGQQTLIAPSDRRAAKTALELEIAGARAALQLRNSAEFKASAVRINQWLLRLYTDTPQLKERRAKLLLAANTPLTLSLPLAGSSLTELQRMKQGAAP
ncbi:MAG TPA: uroporphyrinogen-III C-methyltransferase [Arenimonas sp.]|nr:uroporphyrinogen-III C-methyltransferase [Arenimonas sp.]